MDYNWIVSQVGARQHYSVPRGFLHRDDLRLFYTEAWCRFGQGLLRQGPKSARSFAGRYHPDLPSSKVVSFNTRLLYDRLTHKRVRSTANGEYMEYLRLGKWFAQNVCRDLSRRTLNAERDVFFGFNTACLETLEMFRERGLVAVCDQIDPARVEEQLIYEEAERWPGWQKLPGRIPEAYWQRMDAEWAAASIVLVNSQWSRQALIQQKVPAEKIVVVPIAYEPERHRPPPRKNLQNPLTILWLGLVNLRKGIQYLIEAARLLQDTTVQIIVAGPILIADEIVKQAPANMKFLGKVQRIETLPLYRNADVFVLPTLSDGFAVSQLEAMSQALPVITTLRCGEVVTDGVDGIIIPTSDAPALANAIRKLDSDRHLLREMSYSALNKSMHFYLPRQAQRLEEVVRNCRQGRPLDETHLQIVPREPVAG